MSQKISNSDIPPAYSQEDPFQRESNEIVIDKLDDEPLPSRGKNINESSKNPPIHESSSRYPLPFFQPSQPSQSSQPSQPSVPFLPFFLPSKPSISFSPPFFQPSRPLQAHQSCKCKCNKKGTTNL